MYLKAFDILSADIDDKFNIGHKVFCGGKVGDCFNNAVINRKCVLYNVLTVTCYGRRNNIYFGIYFVNLVKKLLHNLNGVSL